MTAPYIPSKINCGNCELHYASQANVWFLEDLFKYEDIKKYYVLRPDHANNIMAFCQYIININSLKKGINYIIYDSFGIKIGFISAELILDQSTNMPMWNMGYAIHPAHRRLGYATAAVNALTNFLLQNYSIQKVSLDISLDNTPSQNVAIKCGFLKNTNNVGYIDFNHPEVSIRIKWVKQLSGERVSLFNQAVHYHRQKKYAEAITTYREALSEPYIPGTPFTDAQIHANIGMALSSMKCYNEAFYALKKAQSLGLNNATIEKELLWLKNNIGLY